MDYSQYLSKVSLEEVEETLQKASSIKDGQEYIDYLLNLPDSLRVLLITKGLMLMCIELNFDFEGQDVWDACEAYNSLINQVADSIDGLGYYS